MSVWIVTDDHDSSGYYVNVVTGDRLRVERAMIGAGPLYHYQVVMVYPDGTKTLIAASETLIWDSHPECRPEDVQTAIDELGRMQRIVEDILGWFE